jgi:galactonate dehydratase
MTRIVDVETHVVNARLRNWVFVKVITDQPGLIGWGEATLEWKAQAVVGAVKDLRPLIIGGPTALKKIAALAESWHLPLAPHNPLGPIATAVNQHLAFTTQNFLVQEVMRSDVPWRDDVVEGGLPIENGHVTGTTPGWGIDIVEREATRHPYQPEPVIDLTQPDGFITDW